MSGVSHIGLFTAFLAGLVSFLSPCVLPLVPGYVSYVSGLALKEIERNAANRLRILFFAAYFVLGFSTVFIALGASATALSQLLLRYRFEADIAGGAVVVLFGAFMTGLIPISLLHRDMRFHGDIQGGRPLGAYALGLAFAIGWTPCIGPVLGAILTVSALSSTAGVALLGAYSIGLGVPFLASAAFADGLMRRLTSTRRLGRTLQMGAGGVMIVMGLAMVTGTMATFSYWLLETVPILAKIG
jgi:cytochrome c-type biogenesis protein